MTHIDLRGGSEVEGHLRVKVILLRQFGRQVFGAVVPVDAASVAVQIHPHHLTRSLREKTSGVTSEGGGIT